MTSKNKAGPKGEAELEAESRATDIRWWKLKGGDPELSDDEIVARCKARRAEAWKEVRASLSLDPLEPRADEMVDEIEFLLGAEHHGLVLEPVSGPDLDDLDHVG